MQRFGRRAADEASRSVPDTRREKQENSASGPPGTSLGKVLSRRVFDLGKGAQRSEVPLDRERSGRESCAGVVRPRSRTRADADSPSKHAGSLGEGFQKWACKSVVCSRWKADLQTFRSASEVRRHCPWRHKRTARTSQTMAKMCQCVGKEAVMTPFPVRPAGIVPSVCPERIPRANSPGLGGRSGDRIGRDQSAGRFAQASDGHH